MRLVGTISRGIRLPVITEGADLISVISEHIKMASVSERDAFTIRDGDIVGVTESLLARAQGNYVTIDDIAADVRTKIPSGDVGVVFPIISRNRFYQLLRGIAAGVSGKVHVLLSYPSDEVGNNVIEPLNFYTNSGRLSCDCFGEKEYYEIFGKHLHPFTGVDYVRLYKDIDPERIEIHFANNPLAALNFADTVIVASIHARALHRQILEKAGAKVVPLSEICSSPVRPGAGYNEDYGLLGSNYTSDNSVKLFPRGSVKFVRELQAELIKKTGKKLEVLVYGDGAFKDPSCGIWELADPVVSPGYTDGLEGMPNEIKLKYVADNADGKSPAEAVREAIASKSAGGGSLETKLGTTPRRLTDLIGSLCDLTSGSGDKGTPVIYIQGYFDSYIDD